jgi:hypothetical protein
MHIFHPTFILAYLDLGSGSFIIQVLIATVLGSAVLIKTFWRQITGIFRRGQTTTTEDTFETEQQ